jgi:hypothetical protein
MGRRHSRIKPQSRKKSPAPAPPTPGAKRVRDRLIIAAWLVLPMAGIVAILILAMKAQWNRSIDDRLNKWQQSYDLSAETVTRLRRIELEFHGSGNPFTSPIPHSKAEEDAHHEQIASLMAPEEAERFLRDMHSGRWKH